VITEADALNVDHRSLASLFSAATSCNAVSAVVAGLVGNTVVEFAESPEVSWIGMDEHANESNGGGDGVSSGLAMSYNAYTPAFDVAAVSLLLCSVLARFLWKSRPISTIEASLGAPGSPKSTAPTNLIGVSAAVRTILNSKKLLSIGLVNSLFEGVLHLFVFVWTPILEKRRGQDGVVPYGDIFSAFMVFKMMGSQAFSWFEDKISAERLVHIILLSSALCFGVTVVITDYWFTVSSFCAFEFVLGMYWPSMAVLRAAHVPNRMRATMTSAFRIPLNVLVIVLLLVASRVSDQVLLALCSMLLITCSRLCFNEL
jgi:hypothetical protein